MKVSGRRIALLGSVVAALAACERVLPPTVEPTGVRLSGIGLRGATLVADLRIENPNDVAIETDSITFEFAAADPDEPGRWTPVTSGGSHQRLRIEPGGSEVAQVPIELGYSDLSAPLRGMLDKGTLRYRVTGEVRIREPRRTRAPFSKTGSLSMSGN
jgi:LEA14-like dessication related protein